MSIFDNPDIDNAIKQAQSTAQNKLREFDSQKKARYKVHPDKAAEFFADPNTNAYRADEAAQDWIKAYRVTSESGNTNPKGLNNRLKLALREHKKWSDERDIQPLSLSKEVRHDRRMENISGNLDNWSALFSEEGFDREIERRGLAESYNDLLGRGMDKTQVQNSLRRKLFTKDLAGKKDALSQARVSQHILGLEDQSDDAYVAGAQSWVEGKRKYRDEISNARKSAADNFFKREVAVDWGLEAQKKISSDAADAYSKAHYGFKKKYGDIVPVVRDLVDNMKAEGARGLFEETEEVDVNWGKIMELYGDHRRDDFLYVLGKISEQEEVNVDGFIARNAKGMSRTVERMAKAGMRLIDQVKTEASGVSNESLRDRPWNQFQADIADLKGNVARIEASNDFEKIANFTTASLPYMVFAATGVGTGLIAATEAQGFSENMRAENPNLTYEESMRVALPAGAVYAGIEKLQVGGLLGKFPGMQGVVNKLTSGTSLGSWARRVAATTLYEYGQETFQDAVEPLSRDIANQFKAEVPEGDWSTFEVVSKDRLLGVIGLSVLGGTGQWARDRFTQLEVKEELQDKFSLQRTGATVEEANEIAEMAEKDPDAALQQYKKKVFSKSIEERKEISEAAVKSAEDAVATGVLDGLPVVTSNEGGGFVVDFKDGTKKTVESREEAQIAIDQRMEENFLDSAQAVRDRMENLLERSEGDNKAEIAKPRTFQELADLGVETVERLKEAVAVSFMQRGEAVPENIDLNNYTEQGSVTLRRKMAGFAVRLAKDKMTLPSTVDEEFSEGFLRLIVEKGETTFDEVKTMLDEFGAIAGIDMTQGYDVDPNRAVIEGFSKFAKAYMLQGDHKSIPKSSQAWYRKAWRVLENPDSVPAPLRAFAELVTKLLRSVFDVAQAIRSQKQDGEGINPELESLAMRALGLNEQQIAEEAQAKATKEIQEELGLDPEADADPTFSIGNTTVTPNADTKTYPTKDGGVVGPASFSITAHHGTPHKVGQFSTENIGTGEGAQAYGWGLYFAENIAVARGYRSSTNYQDKRRQFQEELPDDAEIDEVIEMSEDGSFSPEMNELIAALAADDFLGFEYPSQAISAAFSKSFKDYDPSERLQRAVDSGNLYTVDLNVEQDELLDWDKPMSEQSESVQEIARRVLPELASTEMQWIPNQGGMTHWTEMADSLEEIPAIEKVISKLDPSQQGRFAPYGEEMMLRMKGEEFYNSIASPTEWSKQVQALNRGMTHGQEASEALAAAGIKGIRYLDGDSRADGEGTSNYVIFDDADIKITEENGQVVDTASPSFSITPKDEKMSEAVDQIFNGSARFAEFSDKVRKKKEEILARHREQYNKAESESERAIIEVESLAQAEGLYMALPSSMKAIRSEIEEVAELIVERRSGVDSLKMKEDEGLRSVVLPFKLPKAVSEFRIIKALRINLTARGRLTREQHKIKMAAEATQLAELKEAEQVVARLRKQINKTVKGEIARDMLMRQAQEVATGDAKMDTLPKEIQPIVQEARDQVDRLSQKMIDSGIAKGDLAKVFERQMGNYLNRSYRRFTRPESWAKEVPQEARDAAKEYLRKELPADAYTPGVSRDDQLDGYVDNLLQDSVSGSMMDSMTALLGQKHLGNLIGRKSIPKPIRDLWGEYKRLDENYLNSVRKMAGQVASHSILEDFKKDGLGDMIFDKPRKGYATPVAAEGNEALAPLDGYYVSEEMAQALKDFAEMGKKEIGTWLKWWLKFNSLAKVSKTIYNPTTHSRNFFSNFGYVLANDNFFEYARSGKDSAVINFKEIFGFARTPEIEDRIRYYVRLGIMHQGAVSQEFKDILKDFSAGEVDIEEYSQKKLLKIAKAPLDVIQAAYQAEDDFHKIVAFESEKRKLAKHKKNWSQEKIDREAAQIIRDTMPDYSQVPTAVKALRRVPLVGTFTSFTAEVLRNNHNIIARAITEMKDPDLKVVGIRRMSFFMMAHAVPIALAAFLKEMFDVDDEEDEATRAIAAPWDKDSLLMYVGRSPSGDPKYANFSYTDPFSIFKTPFIISQREGLSATSITKGVWKGLEPFYGVEIGTKALMEAANNQDDLGRDISNENDDVLTQARDRSIHVIKALEPGFLRTGERIKRAYTGEKTPSGKEFDLATEIGAVITGQRITTVSREDAVKYRTWDFTDDKRNASTAFNKAWRSEKADRESLTEAIEEYRRDTKLAFEGYQDVLKAVSVLGLSDEEILAAGYDNPKTPTAQVAQSLLDAKVGETPIPDKKFSKSHLKEIREIEGREKLLRELIPEAF